MTLDDLKGTWQRENANTECQSTPRDAWLGAARRAERAAWANRLFGLLTLAATILVVTCFGRMVLGDATLLTKLGAAMVVVGSAAMVCMMPITQLFRRGKLGATTREFFQQEVTRTERQIAYARSLSVWGSMGALCAGVIAVAFDARFLIFSSGVGCLMATIYITGYMWIRRRVTNYFVPLRDDLREMLLELER